MARKVVFRKRDIYIYGALILIGVVGASLFYVIIIREETEKLAKTQAELKKAQTLSKEFAPVKNLEKYGKEILQKTAGETYNKLRGELLTNAQFNELLKNMPYKLTELRLKIRSFDASPEKKITENIFTVSVDLEIEGGYHDIAKFLNWLEKKTRPLCFKVIQWSMTCSSKDKMKAIGKLDFYYYGEKET